MHLSASSLMSQIAQSDLAARLQNAISERRWEAGLYREIAEKLPLPASGRLLDIGTGSGLQLRAIREARPGLKLYGLDLSAWAIRVARANLVGLNVKLRQGSIERAPYPDDFFDLATCHASMSYWKRPLASFNEVFRILKPGAVAVFFEPNKEIDFDQALAAIRANLANASVVRRSMATGLNKVALKHGRRLGLKLYAPDELAALITRSDFEHNFRIEKTALLDVPIFIQITLAKPCSIAGEGSTVIKWELTAKPGT